MAYNKLSTYKTRVNHADNGDLAVIYHDTAILRVYREAGRQVIELNTGGETGDWHTSSRAVGSVTTKKKLNQASHQFDLKFSVHQHKHRWYVTTCAGEFLWDDSNTFVIDAYTGLPYGLVDLFTAKEQAA